MRVLFFLPLFLFATVSVAQSPIKYRLKFPQAASHYVHVDVTVTDVQSENLEYMMAVWTPGSYLLREYSRHIDQIAAMDDQGNKLSIDKTRKNRWTVTTKGADTVVVSYRLYCREMSVRTNWVEEEFAMLNGAPTFLTLVDGHQRKHIVVPMLTDKWKQAVSPLPNANGVDGSDGFVASNFDELVDSPLLLGNPQTREFKVGGKPHWLVNQNGQPYWDIDKAAKDVEKIVAEHQRMWQNVPYPRYVFFNMVTESGGGLEHDNSTVMMTSRWRFRVQKEYKRWLGLVSHEFFHTWNVRRLRPRSLRRYDYEQENYTDSLWIAEGITSYYELLALARCGLLNRTEFLETLSADIDGAEKYPGKTVQSLTEASRDTWIKHYRPDENSRNTRVSYYGKGSAAAFLLDAKIRRVTKNAKSLDDVMRLMFDRHAKDGYLPEDFRTAVADVAGQNLGDWFRTHIDTPNAMQYGDALNWYGLKFAPPKGDVKDTDKGKTETETSETDDSADKKDEKPKTWTGFTISSTGGHEITRVQNGSPAAIAGLNVGDEVIAIDGFRVSASKLADRLKQYKAGDTITILAARRQQIIHRKLTLAATPLEKKLRWIKEPTDEQKANATSWLMDDPKSMNKPTHE